MEESNRIIKNKRARVFIDGLASAMLRNNATDRTSEIKNILNDMKNSDIDWDKDVVGRYKEIYKGCIRNIDTHLNLWKNKKT
jgi:hypothetical protein